VFQDGNLFPHLSIARNVALGINAARRLASADQERVLAALDRVGLGAFADRKPGNLSGGQQSRAALARVLVMGRPLLLLDEPFAALGPAQRGEMLDLVTGLCDDTGATLIMVSHAPEDARRIGGVTSVVADGVASVPVETGPLLANPPEVLRDYLG
jgi:thiamine transport system ATP-binding protein